MSQPPSTRSKTARQIKNSPVQKFTLKDARGRFLFGCLILLCIIVIGTGVLVGLSKLGEELGFQIVVNVLAVIGVVVNSMYRLSQDD